MSLVVTGSIGLDTVDTPTGSASEVLGGSAVYFAAAASFFSPVRLIAAVGDDFPDEHLDTFRHFGVDLQGLERRAGSKTFRWHGKYLDDINQRETLGIELGVLAEALPPVPQAYQDSQHVFLATTTPENQLALLDQFPNAALTFADTIELYIDTSRDALVELMNRIDGIVINDAEAKMLTGKADAIHAADALVEHGLSFVVIKKGEHGVLLRHAEGFAALPAYPSRTVIDPTGAGDTFAAGMMSSLGAVVGDGKPTFDQLKTAMAWGTVIASYTIEDFSVGRLKTLTQDDIQTRHAELKRVVNIA